MAYHGNENLKHVVEQAAKSAAGAPVGTTKTINTTAKSPSAKAKQPKSPAGKK